MQTESQNSKPRTLVAGLAVAFLTLSVAVLLIAGGIEIYFSFQTHREAIAGIPIPVVSHEIASYEVFPDFKEIEKYTGVLRARNFEVFRENLDAKHMLDQADDFFRASGGFFEGRDYLFLTLGNFVLGFEPVFDIDAQAFYRQILYMTNGSSDVIVRSQIFFYGPDFGG